MKKRTVISLLLLIPAPTLGVLFGMVLFPDAALGKGMFLFSKIWILALPALWFLVVERSRPALETTAPGGFRAGWISGLVISAFVLASALAFVHARARVGPEGRTERSSTPECRPGGPYRARSEVEGGPG